MPRIPEQLVWEETRALVMLAEQQVCAILSALCEQTGLDLRHVEVMRQATAVDGRDAPQVLPVAVRIELTI